MVPAVSLMINHFDLFGTRQVWLHLRRREYTSLPFRRRRFIAGFVILCTSAG